MNKSLSDSKYSGIAYNDGNIYGVKTTKKRPIYSTLSDYSGNGKPPPKPDQGLPPSPPVWYWHGTNWLRPHGCDNDGVLVIFYNCDYIDSTVNWMSWPGGAGGINLTPNSQYNYNQGQASTPSAVNGYQLPDGLFGCSYAQPPTMYGTPPAGFPQGWPNTSYGYQHSPNHASDCCGWHKSFTPYGWNGTNPPWQGQDTHLTLRFHLNNQWGFPVPLSNFPGGCPPPTTGATWSSIILPPSQYQNAQGQGSPPNIAPYCELDFICTDLGNNHYEYKIPIGSSFVPIQGSMPGCILYNHLPAGEYGFYWDEIIFNDGLNGDVTQVIANSTPNGLGTFQVLMNGNTNCPCLDPTNDFNKMPIGFRDNWMHWYWLDYDPPLIHTTGQYNWLINWYNTESSVPIGNPPVMTPWGNYPLTGFANPTSPTTTFSGGPSPSPPWAHPYGAGQGPQGGFNAPNNLPAVHMVENWTANTDYPNQSTFCEYCRDWQNHSQYIANQQGTPIAPGATTQGLWGQYQGFVPGQPNQAWDTYLMNQPTGQTYDHWMLAPPNPQTGVIPFNPVSGPINKSGKIGYSIDPPFATMAFVEAGCHCCPLDMTDPINPGVYWTSVGLEPPGSHPAAFWVIPPTGTWLGPG